MLALARAIIEPRKLILVDEPTKGLAPAIIRNMIAAFRELKGTETTILLVEQNFMFAQSLGDGVAVMDDGKIKHSGTMPALAADKAMQQRLLGLYIVRRLTVGQGLLGAGLGAELIGESGCGLCHGRQS